MYYMLKIFWKENKVSVDASNQWTEISVCYRFKISTITLKRVIEESWQFAHTCILPKWRSSSKMSKVGQVVFTFLRILQYKESILQVHKLCFEFLEEISVLSGKYPKSKFTYSRYKFHTKYDVRMKFPGN